MPKELTWQQWLTLEGAASTAKVSQPADNWLDVSEAPGVTLRIDLMYVAGGVTLVIQTAPTAHGPWVTQNSYTAVTKSSIITSAEPYAGPASQTQRFVRWALDTPAGTWSTCFRLRAGLPETSASDASVSLDEKSHKLTVSRGKAAGYEVSADRTPGVDEIQPWLALRGGFTPSTPSELLQSENNWLDTSDKKYLVLEAQVLQITGATLILEAAMGPEGPWTAFGTFASASGYSFQTFALSKEQAATVRLRRLVRWHIEGSGNAWQACFRLNGTAA